MIFDAHMHVALRADDERRGRHRRHRRADARARHRRRHAVRARLDARAAVHGRDPRPVRPRVGEPKAPGYVEETERWLDTPRFRGIKLHPTFDGFHRTIPRSTR